MDMNYSLADIAQAVRGNGERGGGGILEGDGILIILLFLLLGGGFGNFGNRGGEGMATEADVQRGFNQQTTTSKLDQLGYGQASAGYETARMINGVERYMAETAAQSQLTMCQGFGGVSAAIADLGRQMQQCCCDIKSTLAQDKIESLQAKVTEQAAALGNMQQSQFILSQMGRWRSNPPCPENVGCGCGFGFAS